jgi:hypothetical protein
MVEAMVIWDSFFEKGKTLEHDIAKGLRKLFNLVKGGADTNFELGKIAASISRNRKIIKEADANIKYLRLLNKKAGNLNEQEKLTLQEGKKRVDDFKG